MTSDPNTGIFIFRRDLRIQDNIGLHEMSKICKRIIPIFIFTPEQVTEKNKFRSRNAIQFMIESLDDLAGNLSIHKSGLYCFMGENATVIESLLKKTGAKHVGFNRDYTPYAIKRDREIADMCAKLDVQCHLFDDYYLFPPGTLTKTGFREGKDIISYDDYYRKFTPFYGKAIANANKMRKSVVLNPKSLSKLASTTGLGLIHLTDMYIRYASMNPNVSCRGLYKVGYAVRAKYRNAAARSSARPSRFITELLHTHITPPDFAVVPPTNELFSSTRTLAPVRAAASAAP